MVVNDYITKGVIGITIKDVAREAGVSVATISRVINNSSAVSEETRLRVEAAIAKTGYQHNLLGRNLRCNKTNIILVMLTSIVNSFCAKLVHSIDSEAKKHSYNIMICATNNDPESEARYLNYVRNRLADGIIVLNSSLSAEKMAEFSSQCPVVQCSEYVDGQHTPYITIDNQKAAYTAVTHLLEQGRKRILFIGVKNGLHSSIERYNGYADALQQYGLPITRDLIFDSNYGYRSTLRLTREYLQTHPVPDGVFAISDKMAAAAIAALKERGCRVPQDTAVVGFDNTDITYIYDPTITTVSQPHREMGRLAVQAMLERLNGTPCQNAVLGFELVQRQSTTIKKERNYD